MLACGIVNAGVQNAALAVLSDYINHKNNNILIGAIFGLSIAYAEKIVLLLFH